MRKVVAALALFVALLAGALTAPSVAQAAPGCPSGRICLHDTSSSGPFWEVESADTIRNKCIGGLHPVASWVTNNTPYRWIVSTSNDCSANRGVIYPNSAGGMAAPWNNNIRGIYRTSSTSFDVGYPPAMVIKGGGE